MKNRIASGARRLTGAAFVVFLLLSFPPAGAGEADRVSVSTAVDRSVITIGDLITLSVTVTHAPEVEIRPPAPGVALGDFEVRDSVTHPARREGDRVIERFDLVLTTFETGDFSIPPIEIGYREAGENDDQILETESFSVTVESVNPDEDGEIREIKPPWEIPVSLLSVLIPVAIGLAALLAGLGAWRYLRRRRGRPSRDKRKAEPMIPPHLTALAALRELQASNWLEKGRIKAFYSRASEIIRRYIEGRFRVAAMESTTTELMAALRPVGISRQVHAGIGRLLELSDLVKFARYRPSEKKSREALSWAFEIVETTRPLPAPSEEAAGPPADAPEAIPARPEDGEGER